MKANNGKIRPNRYKPAQKAPRPRPSLSGLSGSIPVRWALFSLFFVLFGLAAIFTHDLIMQWDYLALKKIEISGNRMAAKKEIVTAAGLAPGDNLLSINGAVVRKRIASLPWVESVSISRSLPDTLRLTITEQMPLAVVRVGPDSDIIINRDGHPFKEFDPEKDSSLGLPVIEGLELEKQPAGYGFAGRTFESALAILKSGIGHTVKAVRCHTGTGIRVQVPDTYNPEPDDAGQMIWLKLGFDRFTEKLARARQVADYMNQHTPDRRIQSMDLFDMENIFVKTTDGNALHNNLEKGV